MTNLNSNFIEDTLEDLTSKCATHSAQCWDVHAHLIGQGTNNSGVYLNRSTKFSLTEQMRVIAFKQYTTWYLSNPKEIDLVFDETYANRFNAYAKQIDKYVPFGVFGFAFCGYHCENGIEHKDKSDFIVPNQWSKQVADKYSNMLYVCSIHPFEKDAIAKLEAAYKEGAKAVKWLGCAQNIDPASKDPRYTVFYDKLVELDMPIISHAGKESAVKGDHVRQEFGNPLRLRSPLDRGVKIIIAHCASDGFDEDTDSISNKEVATFDLFKRMFNDPAYKNNLYADISAMPLVSRSHHLKECLVNEDWHGRLLNGSDYPLPAFPIIYNNHYYWYQGLINRTQVRELNKIKKVNPLFYDFLLKKAMSYNGLKFPDSVFMTSLFFDKKDKNAK